MVQAWLQLQKEALVQKLRLWPWPGQPREPEQATSLAEKQGATELQAEALRQEERAEEQVQWKILQIPPEAREVQEAPILAQNLTADDECHLG